MRNGRRLGPLVIDHPPRCLAPFVVSPQQTGSDQTVRFKLASPSGQAAGSLFGSDLSSLNPEYAGEMQFVSPLSILWPGDSVATPLLDTEIHGYIGELHDSAKLRGSGNPDTYACAACGGHAFWFEVTLHYWDATYELWDEEPSIAIQDYFNLFTLVAICTGCRRPHNASEMDL